MNIKHLFIYRYNPETEKNPKMIEYKINTEECDGVMLLDALTLIKDKNDETLSFRRSCGEGVCGSDGININGRNGLACITPLSSLGEKIVLRPLPGMPVIKDLIVDMTNFYNQYKKINPFLQNNQSISESGERLQSPEERKKLDGLYECILCACCSSFCPSYWWNPNKFIGPAAGLQSARFIFDSRDDQYQNRLSQLDDDYSILRCRSIMNCTSVCPKGLNPASAINSIIKRMIKESL